MARYYDLDKLSKLIEARADTMLEGKCAMLYVAKWLNLLPTADVVEMSKIKEVIMQYIAEQTVSKYPTAELCRASRMGAEGVLYALEYAFEEVQNEQE